jgi:hypothetical protein
MERRGACWPAQRNRLYPPECFRAAAIYFSLQDLQLFSMASGMVRGMPSNFV